MRPRSKSYPSCLLVCLISNRRWGMHGLSDDCGIGLVPRSHQFPWRFWSTAGYLFPVVLRRNPGQHAAHTISGLEQLALRLLHKRSVTCFVMSSWIRLVELINRGSFRPNTARCVFMLKRASDWFDLCGFIGFIVIRRQLTLSAVCSLVRSKV